MKPTLKTLCLLMLAALAASAALAQIPAAPGESPPAPVSVPRTLDEAAALVVVGDVPGLIDRLGGVYSQMMPGMDGTMLKTQIGSLVGDPTLDGITTGCGAALVFFPDGAKALLIEASPSRIDDYKTSATAMGSRCDVVAGLLATGDDESDFAAAKAVAGEVKNRYLEGQGSPTVEATLFMPRIMKKLGPVAEAALSARTAARAVPSSPVPGAVPPLDAAQVGESCVRALLSVANQVDTVFLRLSVEPDAVKIEKTVKPLAGSNLAALLAAPVAEPSAAVTNILPALGAVRAVFAFDMSAVQDFAVKEATNALSLSQVDPARRETLVQFLKEAFAANWGGGAFEGGVPGASLSAGYSVYESLTPASVVDLMRNMPRTMENAGILDMYRRMGTPMTVGFRENIRERGGVAIHQLAMTADMTTMSAQVPGADRAILQQMGMGKTVNEIAVVGNWVLQGTGGQSVDPLIDAALAGKSPQSAPIEARRIYGPDTRIAIDVRPMQLTQVLSPIVRVAIPPDQPNPLDTAAMAMASALPLQAAAKWNATQFDGTFLVPTRTIMSVTQAVVAVQMQMMMQARSGATQGGATPGQTGPPAREPIQLP